LKVLTKLKVQHGITLKENKEFDFDFTNYYLKEFGENLKKIFVVFDKQIKLKDLVKIKKDSIQLEAEFKTNKKRVINIDPGCIGNKVLVATTKNLSHRIHIGDNIYYDKQLELKNKPITFKTTFADYKKSKEFFFKISSL